MAARRQVDYAERIRGWFDAHGVTQQQLAIEAEEEPATVCRNIAECDPYALFKYGQAFERVKIKQQGYGR